MNDPVLGKIASGLDAALSHRQSSGSVGHVASTRLARGDGWSVDDVICTSGPADRSFEEGHGTVSIAIVAAGSFQYRSRFGREVMTPGSLLLGNAGDSFECSHDHAAGDRCIAFHYAPDVFERLAADAGVKRGERTFRASRVPPIRALSPHVARASVALATSAPPATSVWDAIAIQIAARAIRLSATETKSPSAPSSAAVARVTESVRSIERSAVEPWTLEQLARDAGHSLFHYLRTFRRITGVTPHQFILRARLRVAAMRLATEDSKVIDIAFGVGFEDVSNFNRSFRLEFGVAPMEYRRRVATPGLIHSSLSGRTCT
ncbi:MAG: AraC family transcriptional regulator [bacterium]